MRVQASGREVRVLDVVHRTGDKRAKEREKEREKDRERLEDMNEPSVCVCAFMLVELLSGKEKKKLSMIDLTAI